VRRESHDVVRGEPDTDELALRVVVVTRHQRQHASPARQLQRVQEIRAAEHAIDHARAKRRGIVVHHVVGAKQDVDLARA